MEGHRKDDMDLNHIAKKKCNKPSHLSSFKKVVFGFFFFKNDLNHELIKSKELVINYTLID